MVESCAKIKLRGFQGTTLIAFITFIINRTQMEKLWHVLKKHLITYSVVVKTISGYVNPGSCCSYKCISNVLTIDKQIKKQSTLNNHVIKLRPPMKCAIPPQLLDEQRFYLNTSF